MNKTFRVTLDSVTIDVGAADETEALQKARQLLNVSGDVKVQSAVALNEASETLVSELKSEVVSDSEQSVSE